MICNENKIEIKAADAANSESCGRGTPIAEMSPVKQSELEGQAQHCIAGAND